MREFNSMTEWGMNVIIVNSASQNSSSIFTFCCRLCVTIVTSYLVSTICHFRPNKPNIFQKMSVHTHYSLTHQQPTRPNQNPPNLTFYQLYSILLLMHLSPCLLAHVTCYLLTPAIFSRFTRFTRISRFNRITRFGIIRITIFTRFARKSDALESLFPVSVNFFQLSSS